ncbi:MAG: hypothetical protein WCP99_24190, partial [Burkholderiales bacterium]
MNENAISLQEAAAVLNLSYSTIFARRFEIGFRIPGSRIWRVWPSTLSNLSNQAKLIPLSLRAVEEKVCQSSNTHCQALGGSISLPQAARELDALLARPTATPRK